MNWVVHIRGGPKRVNHAAVAVGNTIYSFGGYNTDDNYAEQRPIDVHILNPVTFRWRVLNFAASPVVPFQRYGHTCVSYGRYVYLWGGRNDENTCKNLYRFDTKTLSWTKPEVSGSVPGARDGHSAVVIRNKMIIFGGYEEEVGLFSQDVYSLDLNTLIWSFVPVGGQAPSFRDFHTATVYLDRYMFIFGGRGDEHGPFHSRSEVYCNTLVCLDVERQEWFRPKTYGHLPIGRRSHSSFMHNGYMYVFGGYNGRVDKHFSDFYRYNPELCEWREVAPFGSGPNPRRRQGCGVVGDRVYFFGGTSPLVPNCQANRESDDENPDDYNLIDHDDMFVLDMDPSLATLCILKVLEYKLDTSVLPNVIGQEINWMRTENKISPATTQLLSSG